MMDSNNNSLKALPFRLHFKPNKILPHTISWLQLVIACLSNQNSILTLSQNSNQLVLGKKGRSYRKYGWEMDPLLMGEGLIPQGNSIIIWLRS